MIKIGHKKFLICNKYRGTNSSNTGFEARETYVTQSEYLALFHRTIGKGDPIVTSNTEVVL